MPNVNESVFRKRKDQSDYAFANLFLNVVKITAALMLVAMLQINIIQKKTENFELKAEAAVQMQWPDNNPCDVDLYVKSPTGAVVYFDNAHDGVMNLEKDDIGTNGDFVILKDGTKIGNPENVEFWILRQTIPGRYTVNVHLFACPASEVGDGTQAHINLGSSMSYHSRPREEKLTKPLKVKVKLTKFNPTLEEVVPFVEVAFSRTHQELLAFHFDISYDENGKAVYKLNDSKVLLKMASTKVYETGGAAR